MRKDDTELKESSTLQMAASLLTLCPRCSLGGYCFFACTRKCVQAVVIAVNSGCRRASGCSAEMGGERGGPRPLGRTAA